MTDPGPAASRLGRLWSAAESRSIPLRTIVTTVAVVAAAYLLGRLLSRIRDVLLLLTVAGFIALLLNPLVVFTQRKVVRRRGVAVVIVALWGLLVFGGLLFAFGYPLVNGFTHLADKLPSYVASAESGKGWLGHVISKYHIESWVQRNAPKLIGFGQSLSKPALSVGKGAVNLLVEMVTIFMLVLLLLLEGPRMRRGVLALMRPDRAATCTRIAAEVNRAVTGYMLGNLLTSLVAGLVVFATLAGLHVPFASLWGIWVALVDFLPMIGGALAGIPTVAFAFFQSTEAGVITLVVFVVYTQLENHVLNPVVMSRTVHISPLLVAVAVLVAASLGSMVGGAFGGFVAALLAIPAAGAVQVLIREAWHASAPRPASAARPAGAPGQPSARGQEQHGETR